MRNFVKQLRSPQLLRLIDMVKSGIVSCLALVSDYSGQVALVPHERFKHLVMATGRTLYVRGEI